MDFLVHKDAAEAVKRLATLLGGRLVLSKKCLADLGFSKKQISIFGDYFNLED